MKQEAGQADRQDKDLVSYGGVQQLGEEVAHRGDEALHRRELGAESKFSFA